MHRDPVSEGSRPYGAHALAATNYTGCAATAPATHFGGFCFSGSGTEPQGRIKTAALGGPFAGKTTIFSGNTLVPYAGQTFNFAPYQFYQTQGERYTFGATGHYKVNDSIDFYTRLTFAENKNTAQIGPSPLTANFNINCGNPFLSVEERQTIFGTTAAGGSTDAQCATIAPTSSIYTSAANGNAAFPTTAAGFNAVQRLVSTALRLTQLGPRASTNDHNTFQLVGGVKGDLPFLKDWTYDVSAQYGHTGNSLIEFNDALKGNFQNGLLVNPVNNQCYAGGTCVPLNIFTPQSISAAGLAYVRENLLTISSIEQVDMQASFTGDLGQWGGQSPWAHDPIGLSVGAEYRQEGANVQPDANKASGNLVGYSAATASVGKFHVAEGFAETAIPIIQDMPFAKDLSLSAAYRFSEYDRAGDATTFRVGGSWAPVEDFKFRASYDRAVRAPNVAELFTPAGGTSSNSGRDPCSATSPVTTTAALCNATGVPAGVQFTAALNCPTNQCQGAVGGNPFLKPEVAVTREVGLVLTPSFIDGFSTTIDYYDININGFIAATPLQTILNNCYSTAINTTQSAANLYCSFVHRDALGSVATANQGFVVQAEGNIAGDHVKGIDVETNYNMDLGMVGLEDVGSLNFNYRGTWVLENNTLFPGAPTLKCAGLYGANCGEPQNRLKGNLRTTWADPAGIFTVSLLWRYIGAVGAEVYPFNPGFTNTPSLNFGAKNYIDLSGTWAVSEGLELRAGIRNLFDKDPPLTDNNTAPASDINGNTFPNTYDSLVVSSSSVLRLACNS